MKLSRSFDNINEMKRKLRSLKKLEIKIRFNGLYHMGNQIENHKRLNLVWDEFFDIRGTENVKAKFSLEDILSKSKDEFKEIIDEYFFIVYYRYYTENGFISSYVYNPEILKWMELPPNVGFEEIKKRFRELAKRYHPDTGGNADKFIELMENYTKLVE